MSGAEKSRASFAMTFSDLMMGAMIIVIVLLLFLSVTFLRGQGVAQRADQTVYPPGLRAKLGTAQARIRLTVEPAEAIEALVVRNVGVSAQEVGGKGALANGKNVAIREIYLPSGLGQGVIRVQSKTELQAGVFVSVAVLVGGLFPQPFKTQQIQARVPPGTDIFVIGLSKKEIIELAQ